MFALHRRALLELRGKPECQKPPEDWDLSHSRYAVYFQTDPQAGLRDNEGGTRISCACAVSCTNQLSHQAMSRPVPLDLDHLLLVSRHQKEHNTLYNTGRTLGVAVFPCSQQVLPSYVPGMCCQREKWAQTLFKCHQQS